MSDEETIKAALLATQNQIDEVTQAAGRPKESVTLIAVTKTFDATSVLPAYTAGSRHFGENRLPDALEKKQQLPKDINWHFIGTLQSKKVSKAIGEFSLIHSVDSLKLAQIISAKSLEKGVISSILLQVNSSGEEAKQGFSMNLNTEGYKDIFSLPALNIQGLMTMAPFTNNQKNIRSCFSETRLLRDHLQSSLSVNLPHLSMGMSQDYTIAIQEGATLVRIGTAIFGSRFISPK